MTALEYSDIQGLVFSGYGTRMREAAYHLLRVGDPAGARAWLAGLVDRVTPGVPPGARTPAAERGHCLNVALTRSGLEKLGLRNDDLATFEAAFQEGMTSERRSRVLGDTGPSDPAGWDWGGRGNPADVLLLLYAADAAGLREVEAREGKAYVAAGLAAAHPPIRATPLVASGDDAREHFGFADGISQPVPVGADSAAEWAAARAADRQAVPAGEFVFGYTNAYYRQTKPPALVSRPGGPHPLGRNGTYLAVRQLLQDVTGFREFLLDRAGGDRDRADWLAAKVVGRWPSGATIRPGELSDPGRPAGGANDFDYTADPHGEGVPIGSHVRRVNPRAVGLSEDPEESREVADRHRIVRRGRSYGTREADRPPGDRSDRGLVFIGVNANIERQFEFVMQSWMNNPLFGGMYHETDPLVGDPSRIAAPTEASPASATTFTVPGSPIRRRVHGVPRFVTARGGAYFFLPGISGLRLLAGGPGG